jgi:hypothetical protein
VFGQSTGVGLIGASCAWFAPCISGGAIVAASADPEQGLLGADTLERCTDFARISLADAGVCRRLLPFRSDRDRWKEPQKWRISADINGGCDRD